jgi:hypothetical protein
MCSVINACRNVDAEIILVASVANSDESLHASMAVMKNSGNILSGKLNRRSHFGELGEMRGYY